MYCIVKKKRFDNGKFFILLKDNKPIAASGCYLSPWSNDVMIIGSRTWTALEERDEWWQGDYLLPRQYEEAKKFKSKVVMFTFNLYNEWLIKFLKRIKNGKAVTLGEKNSEFYKDLIFFDNIYDIKLLSTNYIFISVPWCHYLSDKWFENWYHRRENEHLYHFNDTSIKNFFKECGYECIYQSSFEDTIRKNTSVGDLPNILSCIFKKSK